MFADGSHSLLIKISIAVVIVIVSSFILPIKLLLIGRYISIVLLGFTLWFFRDPDRQIPKAENIVLSPADGKIIRINGTVEEGFEISIFMSIFNVHVNRIPINGKVDNIEYKPGKFRPAYHTKSHVENEKSKVIIENSKLKIVLVQVAGFLARRIVTDLKVGDIVNLGERFGMIKFGSRVDIKIPRNCDLLVEEGDKVKAGTSIIARCQ